MTGSGLQGVPRCLTRPHLTKLLPSPAPTASCSEPVDESFPPTQDDSVSPQLLRFGELAHHLDFGASIHPIACVQGACNIASLAFRSKMATVRGDLLAKVPRSYRKTSRQLIASS